MIDLLYIPIVNMNVPEINKELQRKGIMPFHRLPKMVCNDDALKKASRKRVRFASVNEIVGPVTLFDYIKCKM